MFLLQDSKVIQLHKHYHNTSTAPTQWTRQTVASVMQKTCKPKENKVLSKQFPRQLKYFAWLNSSCSVVLRGTLDLALPAPPTSKKKAWTNDVLHAKQMCEPLHFNQDYKWMKALNSIEK